MRSLICKGPLMTCLPPGSCLRQIHDAATLVTTWQRDILRTQPGTRRAMQQTQCDPFRVGEPAVVFWEAVSRASQFPDD